MIQLQNSIQQAIELIHSIPAERKLLLDQFIQYIVERSKAGQSIQTNTICTHNSRRSHLGQVWIATMAHRFGIAKVHAFSGGTEATACHPNTIAALRQQGFEISVAEGANPIYTVRFGQNDNDFVQCWSKRFDDDANPKSDFVAIMVCGSADGACPIVFGSSLRLSCTYIDPKVSDGTPEQDQTYQARSLQIGSEMAYVMRQAAQILA